MLSYGMVSYCMVSYGMVSYRIVWYCMVCYCIELYSTVCGKLIYCEFNSIGMVCGIVSSELTIF